MKNTTRSAVGLLLFCSTFISSPLFIEAQVYSKDLRNDVQIESLAQDDLSGKGQINQEHQFEITLDFSEQSTEKTLHLNSPKSHVALSIDDVGMVSKANLRQDVDVLRLSIKGLSANQEVLLPIVSSYNSLQSDENQAILLSTDDTEDICFFFDQKITEINILCEKVDRSSEFSTSIKISSLIEVIPSAKRSLPTSDDNCESWSMMFALDNSSSMSRETRTMVAHGLKTWLHALGSSMHAGALKVGFILFDSDARILMTPTSLSDLERIDLALAEYISLAESLTAGRWTSWSSSLDAAVLLEKDERFDHLILITDNLPNGNAKKKTSLAQTMPDLIKRTGQLQAAEVIVSAVGVGQWDKQQADLWFGLLATKIKNTSRPMYDLVDTKDDLYTALKDQMEAICPDFDEKYMSNTSELSIFPNPGKGILFIQYNPDIISTERMILRLFASSGRLIEDIHLTPGNAPQMIDLSRLNSGVYTSKLYHGDEHIATERIVITQ